MLVPNQYFWSKHDQPDPQKKLEEDRPWENLWSTCICHIHACMDTYQYKLGTRHKTLWGQEIHCTRFASLFPIQHVVLGHIESSSFPRSRYVQKLFSTHWDQPISHHTWAPDHSLLACPRPLKSSTNWNCGEAQGSDEFQSIRTTCKNNWLHTAVTTTTDMNTS